jgi:VanZ family protein
MDKAAGDARFMELCEINIPRKAIGVLATLTLCGIMVAGLWPFHSPMNQVHWLGNQNGIRIDRYGTVVSSGHFETAGSDGPSCSLEVWLKPRLIWDKGTLVAFHNPLNSQQLSLQQYYTDLVLRRDGENEYRQTNLYVDEAFRRKQALITVTSDGQDTAVYLDGNLVTRSSRFGLFLKDLAGDLIVATSPVQGNSWSGQLLGLAMYKKELSADQVAQHYEDWMKQRKPTVAEGDPVLALYLFDEHTGRTVHNRVKSGVDLYIPDRYLVVHQALLELPWVEFHRRGLHLDDILINIGGFVPLGFFLCAYFTSVRQVKHGVWAAIAFGATVSLTIEVLQAYLPTRDSGVMDVITNTLGTGVGVALYRVVALPLARAFAPKQWASYFETAQPGARQKTELG